MSDMFRIHVSNSNSKLGKKIATFNFPAGWTCNPDAPCNRPGSPCYAKKGRFCFKKVKDCNTQNLMAYKSDPKRFWKIVSAESGQYEFFRWFSSGDIVDAAFFEGMVKVAKENPNTKYLCFTKQYKIVNAYCEHHRIPKNLTVVYSTWGTWMPENPKKFPMTYVKFKHDEEANKLIPKKAIECSGYCGECVYSNASCWALKKGESVYFNEH